MTAMKWNRQLLMRTHTLLAAFFLPVGLLFLVSGVLLTFNIKVASRDAKAQLIAPALTPPVLDAVKLVQDECSRQNISIPSGDPSIRDEKNGWSLAWNGTASNAKLTVKDGKGELDLTENGILRRTEQLHKAKGALLFKLFATAWAVGLLLLFASGTIMALQVKALQKMTWIALSLGLVSFFVLAMIS